MGKCVAQKEAEKFQRDKVGDLVIFFHTTSQNLSFAS